MIGGRETRYGWQSVAPAVHARGMGARVGAEVGGAVLWVAGHGEGRARWRPFARAGGDVRGERARPEFRLEGAKAGLQGRRVRVRGADSLGRAGVGRGELGADEGHRDALCLSSAEQKLEQLYYVFDFY